MSTQASAPRTACLAAEIDREAHEDGEEAVVLALQDVAQGELDVRSRPPRLRGQNEGTPTDQSR